MFYIFDTVTNLWLQDDRSTWGTFAGADYYDSAEYAEEIKEGLSNGDSCYVMGVK